MSRFSRFTRLLLCIVGFVLFVGMVFFAVSWIGEYRPADQEVELYDVQKPTPLPDTLTILTWNIGYAGLGDNMDFFYDGGRKVRDTRQRTAQNLERIIAVLQRADADIMLLQEVDYDSRRSYGMCEVDSLRAAFPGYTAAFVYNYKSWWVPIPLRSPMGRVGSGVVTLSRFAPLKTVRYQYPSAFPFPVRLFNLKRCLLCATYLTAAGDTVQINNTHNTAYDTGGMRSQEMNFLREVLSAALAWGEASVTGGDWNQYPAGYVPRPEELSNPYFVPEGIDSTQFGDDFRFVYDPVHPSLRFLDRPYDNESLQTLTDFFLVSKGIRVVSVECLDEQFRASDHNPVLMKIVFEKE